MYKKTGVVIGKILVLLGKWRFYREIYGRSLKEMGNCETLPWLIAGQAELATGDDG